jgi:DNA ligase D-like protein (predicted 3'-phosphoesterase)
MIRKEKSPIFVVQEHNTQQHHYDFRLEMDNQLISWKVPKGLSSAPNEKHLALRTKNTPLHYADFEGTIPENEYGAGRIKILDKGTYESILDDKTFKQGLADGGLKFTLHGEKFKGDHAMAKISEEDGQEKWIIFKLNSKGAVAN